METGKESDMDKFGVHKLSEHEWCFVVNGKQYILDTSKPQSAPPDEFDQAVARQITVLGPLPTAVDRVCNAGQLCFDIVAVVSERSAAMEKIISAAANLKKAYQLLPQEKKHDEK
jgi:hypothetical protein